MPATIKNLKLTAARKLVADGYVMELLLPWDNLGLSAQMGGRISLRVNVNDSAGKPNDRRRLRWPAEASSDGELLELAKQPAEPVKVVLTGGVHQHLGPYAEILTTPEFLGHRLSVREGEKELGSVALAAYQNRVGAFLPLPRMGLRTTGGVDR